MTADAELIAYFGYGSLVNRDTLRTGYVDAFPARLLGWRRHWRPRPNAPGLPTALLTVEPSQDSGCDGLLIVDRAENLPKVDLREARYDRIALPSSSIMAPSRLPDCPLFVYRVKRDLPSHTQPPVILQSYLDAVMQGFLREHGTAGLKRFLSETGGFEVLIHRDRAEPVYPRAVGLTHAERDLFDSLIEGARRD